MTALGAVQLMATTATARSDRPVPRESTAAGVGPEAVEVVIVMILRSRLMVAISVTTFSRRRDLNTGVALTGPRLPRTSGWGGWAAL
jgi:hypothetical protein